MAATEPGLYSLIYVLADSALLSEEASVTMSRSTGSSEVKTVAKGYAGESPGAAMVELDVTNMVPAAGIEFDAGKYMSTMTPIEMGLLAFGKQLTFKGFIISDSIKHSVGSESSYDFKVRGGFTSWE
jgi:uncharacterized membrane protein YcgQ (UPF0703/DUF1980 family)